MGIKSEEREEFCSPYIYDGKDLAWAIPIIYKELHMLCDLMSTNLLIHYAFPRMLLEMTCKVANVLTKCCGVEKGDRVIIYMPTCPLAVAAMLGCARIGAVHWYVFYVKEPPACSSFPCSVLYSVLGAKDVRKRIKTCKKCRNTDSMQ